MGRRDSDCKCAACGELIEQWTSRFELSYVSKWPVGDDDDSTEWRKVTETLCLPCGGRAAERSRAHNEGAGG